MKRIIVSILNLTAATSAFAHDGGHIHPHGLETLIIVGTIAAIAAGLYWSSK